VCIFSFSSERPIPHKHIYTVCLPSYLALSLSLSLTRQAPTGLLSAKHQHIQRNRRWRCEKTLIASTYYILPLRGRPPADTRVRDAAAVQR